MSDATPTGSLSAGAFASSTPAPPCLLDLPAGTLLVMANARVPGHPTGVAILPPGMALPPVTIPRSTIPVAVVLAMPTGDDWPPARDAASVAATVRAGNAAGLAFADRLDAAVFLTWASAIVGAAEKAP